MYNRAEVVDKNFTNFVSEGLFPEPRSRTNFNLSGLKPAEVIGLFESQILSRQLDLRARILKNTNQCFYTIGSSGHEGNAVFGKVFRPTDMAFLHYRSGAFMVERMRQVCGTTPVYDLLLSFVASSEDPISGGRHKVFGSLPLFVPPQTSTIASHLPKAVGAALSICRAKDLRLKSEMPYDSVVSCSFGDASANHASALSAINTAALVAYQNIGVPLVFICEDNNLGISTPTPPDWVENNFSRRPGLEYVQCDGLNIFDTYHAAVHAERIARRRKKPVFLHMKTVRLLGHAGSDVESNYHPLSQIESTELQDPLLHTARMVVENGLLSQEEVINLYRRTEERVAHVAEYVITRPKLDEPEKVRESVVACASPKCAPEVPDKTSREKIFGREFKKLSNPQHMAKLINYGLTDIMHQYPNTLVFGEDVAKKGGVYHVTDKLCHRFGYKRVFNSPLDETSIIGSGIGFAHNGFLPIPEVQFLAYVHNAEDQIRGEAATLSFFSQGQFTNPMVLRIAGLAYQKGFGGHFHNDNSLTIFRDIPGLIVAVPSNGADAAKMLRTCVREAYENGRVCIFIEPIALYMTKDLHEVGDKAWSFEYPDPNESIALGEPGVWGEGKDFAIVTYGNGTFYSLQAQKLLQERHQLSSKVIDLRWVSPLNREALLAELKGYSHVLVVDECRKTGSLSEEIVTCIAEASDTFPKIKVVAADDCFIPLGVAAAGGLPKRDEVVAGALELMGRGL